MSKGWIGVDLDGTLAVYDGWKGPRHIGAPIPAMVERVKTWRIQGYEVRIMTARVCSNQDPHELYLAKKAIAEWTEEHIGEVLPSTAEKDYAMIELWDDRAVTVEKNTGEAITQGRW